MSRVLDLIEWTGCVIALLLALALVGHPVALDILRALAEALLGGRCQ